MKLLALTSSKAGVKRFVYAPVCVCDKQSVNWIMASAERRHTLRNDDKSLNVLIYLAENSRRRKQSRENVWEAQVGFIVDENRTEHIKEERDGYRVGRWRMQI